MLDVDSKKAPKRSTFWLNVVVVDDDVVVVVDDDVAAVFVCFDAF